mgnify:CR=1 FL=1|tara:strand:- start:7128 stop:7574 length:447 start_codon:yes stop_codon:yes gene_type:complete
MLHKIIFYFILLKNNNQGTAMIVKTIQEIQELDYEYSDRAPALMDQYRYNLQDIHKFISFDLKWSRGIDKETLKKVGVLISRFISDLVANDMYLQENWDRPIDEIMVEAAEELLDCLWFANRYGNTVEQLTAVRLAVIPIIKKYISNI